MSNVEQREFVASRVALAGGGQFATDWLGDVQDLVDVLSDHRAATWEGGVLVEGVLESLKLLVFVVAVEPLARNQKRSSLP